MWDPIASRVRCLFVVGYLVVGGSGMWSAGSCAASLALASVTEIDESLHEFLGQGDVNAGP